ncbi:MAG: DUF2232 domain-containing protein, partial [Prevotella sp.]
MRKTKYLTEAAAAAAIASLLVLLKLLAPFLVFVTMTASPIPIAVICDFHGMKWGFGTSAGVVILVTMIGGPEIGLTTAFYAGALGMAMGYGFLHKMSYGKTLCLTIGFTLFSCADKDIETDDSNGKALVAFNVSETQDQAQAGAKAYSPISRVAFTRELALQDLTPEDLTMQKLPVQGKAGAGLCLIETTLPGVPSQREATAQTRADITTLPNMGNFSTTAFYGYSDTSLEPWFYDKDTKKDGNLVAPIYWDWLKNHGCFYAVYPKPYGKLQLSPSTYTGTPYVNFEVEPNVTNQKDLMTACSGNVHLDAMGTAPRTDLTFRHALTAVRFKVGQNLSYSKHITKVEIVNALSKGKYVLPTDKNHTGAWDASTLNAPATFTLGGDGTVSVSTSEAVNNVIMGHNQDNYVFYM